MFSVRIRSIAVLVAIAVVALVAACNDSDEAGDGAGLSGTSWLLTSLAGDDIVVGTELTAEFVDGRVSGSGGCNSYAGGYETDGSKITVAENIAVTAMACEIAVMDQESAYLRALAAADRFSIDGDELVIETGEGDLTFTGAATASNAPAPGSGATVPAVDPANATYRIGAQDVTLVDGRSEVPAAPGSATMTVTVLSERRAYGELADAGADDAGVVVVQDPGGSGTFYYLAALSETAGVAAAPTFFLGDRIVVDGVSISHGRLTVAYLIRRPDEPFAAPPTMPVTRTFVLQSGALVEVGSGACDASPLDQIGSFVFVTIPHPGARVRSGFDVAGCSRTFESTVNWRLLDRAGDEIASGFAMGGGVDGPERFSFTVEYSASEEQVGHLEVFEVDVSGGEGFPPPRNVLPVLLAP